VKPNRHDWAELLRLLDTALDLPEAERGTWLCALPALRQAQLRELLASRAAVETADFLAKPAALSLGPEDTAPSMHAGQRVGPWRLLEPLGRGGSAVVWLAERAEGTLDRRVALKLPRMGSLPSLAARVARERRILAQLQHPHIAQIFEAGVDGAQPWLALELVAGQPITAYALQHSLGTAARLRLFIDVLRAVAHAHAQLVVHRDIKPANVFVTDGGQVKLLDFGVAKLLDNADAESVDTALTQEAGRAMTLLYASPEQVAKLALSTRSDVYSLGVLLHQLLTGAHPYTLKRGSAAELEEVILAADLRRPSQAVSSAALAREMRGDVDTMVLKALQREPAARYASAEAFADDIERHLGQRPIRARPQSWPYRAAKLWARQRWTLAAVALATSALLITLVWALVERERSQAQARRAQAVQAFLATTLGANDPQVAQGRTLSARDLLDRSAARIDADFANTPDVQARLHSQVAMLYSQLGAMAESLRHGDAAIVLYESQGETGSDAHLDMLFERHKALIDLFRWDDARAAVERALATAERHHGAANRWAPRLVSSRGWIALQQGRWVEAVADAERATAMQAALTGQTSPDALTALTNEAIVAQQTGRTARSVLLQQRIGELGPRTPGHQITDLLVERTNLATAWLNQGEPGIALDLMNQAVPALREHLGESHDRVLMQTMGWAFAMAETGRLDDALALQRRNLSVAVGRGVTGDEQPTIQRAALARVLNLAGRHTEALPLARAALDEMEKRYPRPNWARERTRWFVAEALLGSGERDAGIALLNSVRQNLVQLIPSRTHVAHAQVELILAVAQRESDGDAAQRLAAEACARMVEAGEDARPRLPRCRAIAAWLDARVSTDLATAHASFVKQRDAALLGCKRSYNRALAFCHSTCWPPRCGDDQFSAPPSDHGSSAS
jgi:eukaryotic-like serine/threonine-protein kinase